MKNLLLLSVLCSLASFSGSAIAAEPIGYDPARAAISVDPYFDGYGGTIEIDFNADHEWAAIIEQSLWHYQYGSVTEVGLYHRTTQTYPGGGSSTSTTYGWGARLGTLAPAIDYSSFVTTLYYGQPALDTYHYYAEEWNVTDGKTVINVRPAQGSPTGDTPVQWSDLENVYFRINRGEWKKFTDVYEAEPPALPAGITINPDTLNLKSKGNWITVYITPPQGYSAEDIDPATIGLSLETTKTFNGKPEERLLYRAGPSEIIVGRSGPQLMVKFDRSTVSSLLSPGEASMDVFGKLKDNRTFRGTDSVRVR